MRLRRPDDYYKDGYSFQSLLGSKHDQADLDISFLGKNLQILLKSSEKPPNTLRDTLNVKDIAKVKRKLFKDEVYDKDTQLMTDEIIGRNKKPY